MLLRSTISALILMLFCGKLFASTTFQCTHLLKLENPIKYLKEGIFERAVNWSAFNEKANEFLAANLRIEQDMGTVDNPVITVEAKNGNEITRLSCESLTITPYNLVDLKAKISQGRVNISLFEMRVAAVNERYQMAVDKMPNGTPTPVPNDDLRYPLFRHGFQIFTAGDIAFLLSGDYRWLALCPGKGVEADLKTLREEAFRFFTDPAVAQMLNCEDLLSAPKKRK